MEFSQAVVPAKFFFQFVFCAVSLAIVWGTTIERIKFGAYLIYAVVFSALIYPIISHWIFGGGWLQANLGMQDFAGSTVVHLIGATGALAALFLLGPRLGKYGHDGKPNVIPGHNMPLVGLAVLVLWFGWFGFNAGSTLGAIGGRFADVAVVTQLGAASGVLGAMLVSYLMTKKFDMGMTANGAIAALVAITAPSGYVEFWAAPLIGFVAGVIVVGAIVDRPEAGRPGRRALGARHRRRLGHARLRPVHEPAARGAERNRRRRALLHGLVPPAGRPGGRRGRGVHLRVRRELRACSGPSRRSTASGSRSRRSGTASTSSSTACGATPRRSCPSRDRSTVPRRCQQDGRRASRHPSRTRGWRPTRRRARRARSR